VLLQETVVEDKAVKATVDQKHKLQIEQALKEARNSPRAKKLRTESEKVAPI